MMKKMLCVMVWVVMICCAGTAIAGTDVEKILKTTFPDFAFDSVSPSPVKGIYEVVGGKRIFYFAPQEGILILGQMFDKTKRNLTAERMKEISAKADEQMAEMAKDLPLDKAIKTGNGPHVVIEFTDPDCPYCRRAAQFFESRTDVTKYTFFTALPMHPDAKNKVRYILCQKERSKAFEEVMKGKIDGGKYETCTNAEVEDLIKLHESAAAKLGVSGTPFFIIYGRPVSGADIPKLESLLGEKVINGKEDKPVNPTVPQAR
ncbi:MAG TPA: DsbC family protein [Syntrophales bacterium]|nr:DsbC family protein [Syntrophales bacterium]